MRRQGGGTQRIMGKIHLFVAEFEPYPQAIDGIEQVERPHNDHQAGMRLTSECQDGPHDDTEDIGNDPESPLLHEGKCHEGLGYDA